MHYYYVRYNAYPNDRAPEEHEQWLELEFPHDEKQMKDRLSAEHDDQVTIILSAPIQEEQFANKEKAR